VTIRLASALLAVAVLAATAPMRAAGADEESPEKAQARVLLSQGNALFEKGDLRGALADFRAAYALYPSPKLLVNAAAAERELGDAAGAATDLRHFLDDAAVTDEEGALVDRARADLRTLERKVGRVGLRNWPPRSTLEIDGRPARDPTYVKPGTHTIKVHAAVGVEETREIEIGAGDAFEMPVPRGALLTAGPSSDGLSVTRRGPGGKKKWPAWGTGLIVAGGILVIGGAVTAGVLIATSQPKALSGDLGTIPLSDFK